MGRNKRQGTGSAANSARLSGNPRLVTALLSLLREKTLENGRLEAELRKLRGSTSYRLGRLLGDLFHGDRLALQKYRAGLSVDVPHKPVDGGPRYLGEGRLRLAIIADDLTTSSLEHEASIYRVPCPFDSQELAAFQPHFLLVEAAWKGNSGQWTSRIEKLSLEIIELLTFCGQRGIPTFFWNKEDPVHFDAFSRVAALFDGVGTTDAGSVDRYRSALGRDDVLILPFACQPAVHNPFLPCGSTRHEKALFAGSYYAKYGERSRRFLELVNGLSKYVDVDIYDRTAGDPEYEFPKALAQKVVGSVRAEDMPAVYRTYQYAINVDTVSDSQTMCSRRVVELLASGTVVISTPALAHRFLFNGVVQEVADPEPGSLADVWRRISSPDQVSSIVVEGMRVAHGEHTWCRRLKDMASHLGVSLPRTEQHIAVMAFLDVAHSVETLIKQFEAQGPSAGTELWVVHPHPYVGLGTDNAQVHYLTPEEAARAALPQAHICLLRGADFRAARHVRDLEMLLRIKPKARCISVDYVRRKGGPAFSEVKEADGIDGLVCRNEFGSACSIGELAAATCVAVKGEGVWAASGL